MDSTFAKENDEEIAQAIQRGDEALFGVLMSRYKEKFFRYGRKFLPDLNTIDETVSDIFIKTYENIQSFDPSQKFSPWIYRIAHNEFVNALRKKSRLPYSLVNFDLLLTHPAYEDPAVLERERADMRVLIDKGLEKVPPVYREVIILHYLEDLSYKEIADVLHIPVGTVGVRLKRGKEILKQIHINKTQYEQ